MLPDAQQVEYDCQKLCGCGDDYQIQRVDIVQDAKKPAAKKAPAKKKDTAAAQNTDSLNAPAQPAPAADPMVGKPCPLCGKGVIIKGKTAYGCSNWKAGCQYRQPFSQ